MSDAGNSTGNSASSSADNGGRHDEQPLVAADTVGAPVEEPRPEGDVVTSAGEALAHAEQAQRDVPPASAADDDDDARFALYAAHADDATVTTAASAGVAAALAPETTVIAPEPAAAETVLAPVAPVSRQQPIFVQAPEPPVIRGNRGGAGAIGLVAAIAFAVLFFGAHTALAFVQSEVTPAGFGTWALGIVSSLGFWVPVIVFFLSFWLLGAIINRGGWGHWAVWGLVVALLSYAGFVLGVLIEAPFWELTAREGARLAMESLFNPLAIVALVLGREVPIWFGAWVARRGRKVTEANDIARADYERALEAGPQLAQP